MSQHPCSQKMALFEAVVTLARGSAMVASPGGCPACRARVRLSWGGCLLLLQPCFSGGAKARAVLLAGGRISTGVFSLSSLPGS